MSDHERNAHADLICFAASTSLEPAVSLCIARACAAVLSLNQGQQMHGGWRMAWCMLDDWWAGNVGVYKVC